MLFLSIIVATTLVSLISFIGIVFFVSRFDFTRLTFYFVSLASGTMLGSAFLHLIPETIERHANNALLLIGLGIFVFFILEKLLIWRHCHTHQHPHDHQRPIAARMVIAGDVIHNFIDGAIIASSFIADYRIGVSVTAAIVLHEIPQELGDFGILIHGGYSKKRAIIVNAFTATSSILGAVVAYFFLSAMPMLQTILLPLAAGGFLYIALADLIPQLHEQTDIKATFGQIVLLSAGFGLMVLFRSHPH